MTATDYKRALDAACREWETLAAERRTLDTRLADLQRTIATLSRLCGYVPTVPFSLADSCRLVLMRRDHPLTATQVREELETMGFDLSKQASPLASIHVTLKRLVEGGQVRFFPGGPGRAPSYGWKGPAAAVAGRKAPTLRTDELGALFFGNVLPRDLVPKRKKP
jgi:hypothetical protein